MKKESKSLFTMLLKCLLADAVMFAAYFGGGYLTEVLERYAWAYFGLCIAGPAAVGYILSRMLVTMSGGKWIKMRDYVKDCREKEGIAVLISYGVGVVILYGMYLYASVFVMLFNNIFLCQAVAVLFTEVFVYSFGSIASGDNEDVKRSFDRYFLTSLFLNVVIYGALICADSMFDIL